MTFESHTRSELYLLSLLEVDLGDQQVRLSGAIRLAGDEALFVLADDMTFDPGLLPASTSAPHIEEPFGMKGVRLEELGARARIYRGGSGEPATLFDLTLHARARLSDLTLDGALVFERNEPRLAVVTLSATPRLTLADLARSVTGGAWDWNDGVADDFAFESGSLYALKAPKNAPDGYRFPYSVAGKQIELSPGYGAEATVDLFGEPFAVSVVVHTPPAQQGEKKKPWMVLTTTAVTPIAFDFFELRSPRLEICTGPTSRDRYLRVASEVSILDTPVDFTVAATYRDRRFEGSLKVPLGPLDLPVVGGSESERVTLEIDFEWAKGHLHITRLGGLPSLPHDFADRFGSVLNDVRGAFRGGCESIVGGWLKGASSTTISVGLTQGRTPSKVGVQMVVPITVTWSLSVVGETFTADIELEPAFDVPKKLSDLPVALCDAVVGNAGRIAGEMLSDSDFYVALSAEVARRVGAKAAARMLCRALERFAKEIAKRLADLVKDAVAETLAEAAALAAALTAVALAGLHEMIDSFLDLLHALWDWLTGADEDDKEEAERQIREQIATVKGAMKGVEDKVKQARERITVDKLEVSVDRNRSFVASWSKKPLEVEDLGRGLVLEFRLELLTGEAGDRKGVPWPGVAPVTRGGLETSYSAPFESIPSSSEYRLNAAIGSTLRGVRFLTSKSDETLQNAIGRLRAADSDVAHSSADDLQGTLDWLRRLDQTGIEGETKRWAEMAMPAFTTVGSSLIGINTRVATS